MKWIYCARSQGIYLVPILSLLSIWQALALANCFLLFWTNALSVHLKTNSLFRNNHSSNWINISDICSMSCHLSYAEKPSRRLRGKGKISTSRIPATISSILSLKMKGKLTHFQKNPRKENFGGRENCKGNIWHKKGFILKTSPQAKRHKPSLLFTSLTILTFITR